jgi:spermidine synthase
MSPSNLEILAYEDTPLGPLCLRRREPLSMPGTVVTEVTLDHEFLMSSHHTDSERALARLALEMHPGGGLRVLVGGLGLGYTAHEALASPRVAAVRAIEFLPQVIGWLERGLVPLSPDLLADERFEALPGDVYARLDGPPTDRFDLVLIDVDHAPDDPLNHDSAAFYTPEGLHRASRHLAPGGILGVWSAAPSPAFERALGRAFGEVRVVPVPFFNEMVDEETTDWIFLASEPAPG